MIRMNDVRFGYHDTPVLEDVNIEIHKGEFVAVSGQNGAAKTTLLKLALGLLKPWDGNVVQERRGQRGKLKISYVPQQVASFNSGFPSKVLELVQSGRAAGRSWLSLSRPRAADRAAAEQALRKLGMWELRARRIGELSGGQKQRVCIARALVQEPDLLVLDEPTTGMDADSRRVFYELMREQVREGRTVVMVTHALEEAAPYLDRTIELVRREGDTWKCCSTTLCSGHFMPAG
ncbi:metal ABC transporter ATP-binding protein [Paenibacillus sp. IB182496]|uniref:Metal ABC transporter ATP-binding protein n=1 Tax=Paenibacillus sabuli TaxID=2772509 RepID=A0A927BTY1_9BACL|nr:metal ABC transporter ATP-binding protein [Paenibacillus sabuli]MBD2846746.1 metal ABC transporter ATP-binding protein [Paenibacillus sabuli]